MLSFCCDTCRKRVKPSSVWFFDRNDHYDQHAARLRLRPCSLDRPTKPSMTTCSPHWASPSVPWPDGGYGCVTPLYASLFGNLRKPSYFYRFPGKNSLEDCKNRSGLSETVCSNCSIALVFQAPVCIEIFPRLKGPKFSAKNGNRFCRIFRRPQIIQKS
jgi:hypothetical protein